MRRAFYPLGFLPTRAAHFGGRSTPSGAAVESLAQRLVGRNGVHTVVDNGRGILVLTAGDPGRVTLPRSGRWRGWPVQVRRASPAVPLGAAWVTDAAALTTALTPLVQTGIQAGGEAARAAAAAKARTARAKKRAKATKAPATAPEAPVVSAWPAWLAPVAGLAVGAILVTVFLRPRVDPVVGVRTPAQRVRRAVEPQGQP